MGIKPYKGLNFIIEGIVDLGVLRGTCGATRGLHVVTFPSVSDSGSLFFFPHIWILDSDSVRSRLAAFITLSWHSSTCPHLGAKFGSWHWSCSNRGRAVLACATVNFYVLWGKLRWEAGDPFSRRASWSEQECLLVSFTVPSVPLLMGHGRDPCVPSSSVCLCLHN